MNREEVFNYLRSCGLSEEQIKVIEGAFTCEDAINRKEAISIASIATLSVNQVVTALEKLPPVNPQEPKTGWIPVSERLPEHYQIILFSTKTDMVFEGRYFKDETKHQWYSFRDECFAWNNVVTAWMPLPEPYKAEGSEE